MTDRQEATDRGPRGRAVIACEYCRQKKLKCSNDRPTCQQCQARGKDCTYVGITKVPRPSKARISRLEEENRRLKDSLAKLEQRLNWKQVELPETQQPIAPVPQSRGAPLTPRSFEGSRTRERMIIRDANNPFLDSHGSGQVDTVAQSHGPTSAVADEIASNIDMMTRKASHNVEESEAIRNALFAKSAKSNQLEKIYLNSGRYDFDGVEPQLATHLLLLYWDRQLDAGAVVYRPVFMRDMACNGPYFSKLLLNAIYFTASKYSSDPQVLDDPRNPLTAGRRFRRRIMELIGDDITTSAIPTVQALLLISYALFNWCDERSLSWLYSGMAFNMITDLGINAGYGNDPRVNRLGPEDVEARRRVFWGAYTIDKFLSLYQGRCIRLRDADTNLSIQFLDDYEEFETIHTSSFASLNAAIPNLQTHTISILKGYCSLSILMSGIMETLYTERSTFKNPSTLFNLSAHLYDQLQNWLKDLPPTLSSSLTDTPNQAASPHILSLRALYHTLEILLHRPFVSDGHLRGASPSFTAPLAFKICVSAAVSIDHILSLYCRCYSMRSVPYTLSYAIYVSATIHARVAAQISPVSPAHGALQRCVSTLRMQKEASLGPKKALHIIESLIQRVGINVDGHIPPVACTSPITEHVATVSEVSSGEFTPASYSLNSTTDSYLLSTPSDVTLLTEEPFEYDMDCIFQSFDISHVDAMQRVDHTQSQDNLDSIPENSPAMLDAPFSCFPLDPLYGLENMPTFV